MKVGFSSFNARAGTVDTTRAFRDAWKREQRCLVITDGFYEWKKPEKQPYAIAMSDDSLMVMAGLWDEWKDKRTGERVRSCTIITCLPNAVAGALHDRMPVILAPVAWAKWLGEETASAAELKALLVPCPDEALKLWPVNREKIGNVRNKSRDLAIPFRSLHRRVIYMDDADKRGTIIRHLEDALALADELEDGATGYLIERALDEARSRQFKPAR